MVASALALLSLAFPPVSIVSSASVALVTLRQGAKEGIVLLFCACLAAGILSLFVVGSYQFALLYGLLLWLPVWFTAVILRETRDLITAIETSVLLAIVAVLIFYLYQTDAALFWKEILETMYQAMQQANPDVGNDVFENSIQAFSHYMTGGVAAGSVYGLLFGLFLGRSWQASLFNPGGFMLEYLSLRTHKFFAVGTLSITAIALISSGFLAELCWNLVLILFVLYTFTGASVLHAAFSGMKTSRFMVPFLYATMVLVPHVMILVAVLGLLDTGFNLRNKFKSNRV